MVVGGEHPIDFVGPDQGSVTKLRERRGRVEHSRGGSALQLREPHALDDVRPRFASLAAIRRDYHDAVHALRPVDRRRGSAPQNFDRRDVVGIQVSQPVDRVVLLLAVVARRLRIAAPRHREQPAGERRVTDDHAIYDVQGIGRTDDCVGAADLYLRAAARGSRVLLDVSAGDSPRERPVQRRCRRGGDLGSGDD